MVARIRAFRAELVIMSCIVLLLLPVGFGLQVQASISQSECSPWTPEAESNSLERSRPSLTCAKPPETLTSGQSTSGVTAKHPTHLPPWFNATTFAAGQKFMSKYFFSQFYGPILAFNIFVSFPDITPVLMSTNKSHMPDLSNKRYLATMLHVKLWFERLAEGSDLLDPLVADSLFNVRAIHNRLVHSLKDRIPENVVPSPHAVDEQFWEAVRKDLENSKIPQTFRDYPEEVKLTRAEGKAKPFSHLAMSLTQWMLAAPQVLFPETCGIYGASEDDFNALSHFWAVVGYAMGMEDEYNIAIQPGPGSLEATRAYYQQMYELYFLPSMFQIDHDGKVLWEAVFKGFVEAIFGKSYSRYVVNDQFMLLTLEELIGIEAPNVRARLSTTDRLLNAALKRLVRMTKFERVRDTLSSLFKKYYFEANSKAVFGFDGKNGEDILESAYA